MKKDTEHILATCKDCGEKRVVIKRYLNRSRCICGGKLKR